MSRIQRGFASEFILSAQTKRLCRYNRCPLNCWLDKLISSEFSVPSFIYLYISCGPNGVSTKQRRTTSAQTTLALVSPNRLSIPQAEESWLSSVSLGVWLSSRVWSSWTPSKMFCRRLSATGQTLWRGNNRSRLIEQAYRISLWSEASAMLNWTLFFFFFLFLWVGGGLLCYYIKIEAVQPFPDAGSSAGVMFQSLQQSQVMCSKWEN